MLSILLQFAFLSNVQSSVTLILKINSPKTVSELEGKGNVPIFQTIEPVSYTHLRAHETG
jgi:hypothetical protein